MAKKRPRRWRLIPIIFIINVVIVAIIGLLDYLQIKTFLKLDSQEAWDLYMLHSIPNIWRMWLLIFIGMGIIWYLVHKDITESLGVALSGIIMVSTGLEDLFYYIWSPQTLQHCMSYLNNLNLLNIASRLVGESCVSGTSLVINAIGGVIFAMVLLYGLVVIDSYIPKMKWLRKW